MSHTTLTYVEGVVRCEDLEEMLFAAAALLQLRGAEEDPIDSEPEDDISEDPSDEEDDDYNQEYEDYLDYMDYVQQNYD